MVNVDFASPSLVLGAALIGCGVLLLQMRNLQTQISRDADIVVAAMVSIVGSTLIFQGWRLDPLLLLCQALTTSVAFWYGLEAFRLRAKTDMDENQPQGMLPPPESMPQSDPRAYYGQQQDPGMMQQGGYMRPEEQQGFYPWGGQQQQGPAGAAPSRWGLPPPSTTAAGRPFADTIRYDYYGNPQDYSYDEQYNQQPYDQQYAAAAGPSVDGSFPGPAPYDAPPQGMPQDGPFASSQVAGFPQQQGGYYASGSGQAGYPGVGYAAQAPPQQQQQQGYYAAGPGQGYQAYELQQGYVPGPAAAVAPEQQQQQQAQVAPGGSRGPAAMAGPGRPPKGAFEPVDDWE